MNVLKNLNSKILTGFLEDAKRLRSWPLPIKISEPAGQALTDVLSLLTCAELMISQKKSDAEEKQQLDEDALPNPAEELEERVNKAAADLRELQKDIITNLVELLHKLRRGVSQIQVPAQNCLFTVSCPDN